MEEHRERALIACSLEQADLADRRDRWLQLSRRARVGVLTTENGLRLIFHRGPSVEGELRRLAELEGKCCAFAEWSVTTRDEEVMLDVTAASDEGIAAGQAMFLNGGL